MRSLALTEIAGYAAAAIPLLPEPRRPYKSTSSSHPTAAGKMRKECDNEALGRSRQEWIPLSFLPKNIGETIFTTENLINALVRYSTNVYGI